jgi:L-seryl-tRNA(Ser) seleniumtransferase
MSNVLRNLPSVNELLESPPLRKLIERANRSAVVTGVRSFLDDLRAQVQNATADIKVPAPGELAERIAEWITTESAPNLRPVINATGVILHSGLGRAPLAESALQAILRVGGSYASLEVDLETGQRSQRLGDAERLLRKLTGAEAAAVVNNHAGATLLALAALAGGREVIVARGQVAEIGGTYRLPEMIEFSGATLREVGTTNKTRSDDYRAAIRPETAVLLRVQASNYAIVGFTEQTSLAELVELGGKHRLTVIDDLGGGALTDCSRSGITGQPAASESLQAGADVVLLSGDKLLGGPQCGIILGRKSLLQAITTHPLMRALRVDKLTLAALLATLELHRNRETAEQSVPVLALLSTPLANLQNRAERLAPQLAASPLIASAEAVASQTFLSGGVVPGQEIPTWCVALQPARGNGEGLAAALRKASPAILGRIQKDRLLLDLRTVFPKQDLQLVEAVEKLSGPASQPKTQEEPEPPPSI